MEVRAVIIYSCCLFHLWILSPKTENSVLQDCAISGRKWKDSQCAKSCVPNWDLWGSKKPSKRIPPLSHCSWLAVQKVGNQLARSWNPNLLLWLLTVMQFVVVVIVAALASSSAFTICNSWACWWWWISGWPELVVVGISCWSPSDWRSPCIQGLFKLYYFLFLQHKFDSNKFVGVFLSTAVWVQLQKMGLVGEEHGACGVEYTDQENRSSFKMLTYNKHKRKTGNESFIKWNNWDPN